MAPGDFRSVSAVSATDATGTTRTVALPAGIVPGDLLVAVVSYEGAATGISATGWTVVSQQTTISFNAGATVERPRTLVRVADGTETSPVTFNLVATRPNRIGFILCYEGPFAHVPAANTDTVADVSETATASPIDGNTGTDPIASALPLRVVYVVGWFAPEGSTGNWVMSTPSGLTSRVTAAQASDFPTTTNPVRIRAYDELLTAGAVYPDHAFALSGSSPATSPSQAFAMARILTITPEVPSGQPFQIV